MVLPEIDTFQKADELWAVVLWNDPVNTMEYVSRVLCKSFGYTKAKAEEIMLAAHENGRATAWAGEQAEAESHCRALHGWGLQATLQKEGK